MIWWLYIAYVIMVDGRESANLQFHRHHSYFMEDFQMLLAAKEGEM